MDSFATFLGPLGTVTVTSNGHAVTRVVFDAADPAPTDRPDGLLADVGALLERYWAGELVHFEVPLEPAGTPFQRLVWRALLEIPYGATLSYAELARRIEAPRSIRAVGRANATNPIAILIPCHRVVGSNGALTGYGGGLERKRALLELEGAR